MEVRSRLVELQKTRKRRLPINETSDLSELQQEANSDDDEENSQTNLIKFEQGITQMGAVSLWHGGTLKNLVNTGVVQPKIAQQLQKQRRKMDNS
ncbi:hypothetical protein ACQ4LE_002577 [Meloidogyne hapla]